MTVSNYGDILLSENPAKGSLNLQILETNTYRGWNYAYDAIGNLERLSRNGLTGGPFAELKNLIKYYSDEIFSSNFNCQNKLPKINFKPNSPQTTPISYFRKN